jgi:acyl carrier protein
VTANETSTGRATALADVVAVTWRDVLGVERLGDGDNFFLLGGDSLVAARLAARLRTALDVRVPLNLVFEYPTVAEFVAGLRAEYGESVDEAAEQYLTVLGCSDATAQAMLGNLDD